jgi:hypothetical protein
MSLRLKMKPDGTIDAIEADSVEELLEYQRRLQCSGNHAQKVTPTQQEMLAAEEEALPEAAQKLVRLLVAHPDGMNTVDVAQALGVQARGVGGSITSLNAWGRKRDLTKRQLLTKDRRASGNGHTVRRIALAERLRRMIQEGKVPGMTLDT